GGLRGGHSCRCRRPRARKPQDRLKNIIWGERNVSECKNARGSSAFWQSKLLWALICLPLAAGAQAPAPRADRIFVNGKIWTADDARPSAEALAVSGDKILAVGSSQEIRALAGPKTVTVDLGGRLMLPGFQDSHTHFPGPSINSVKLDGIETLEGF